MLERLKRTLASSPFVRGTYFRFRNPGKARWRCPVCRYWGPFVDLSPSTGPRRHAQCPRCGALERHRLQYLAVNEVLRNVETATAVAIHFAPEDFFRNTFSAKFGRYVTADLAMDDVDLKVDLCNLPLEDETFDFLYASHVLEHIRDDERAIGEIWRVLRPGGIAVLPVPIVGLETVEYPEPNPNEVYHWRAPGLDYFDRYRRFFDRVDEYRSTSFPPEYQVFTYEDRSGWPTPEMPLRRAMTGKKHIDVVPVCYKGVP